MKIKLELFGASRDFSNKNYLEFNIEKKIELKDFRKEIIKGFTLTADYNTNNNLVVFSIEPNFVIKDIQTLKELINVFSKIKNARREVSLSKENG